MNFRFSLFALRFQNVVQLAKRIILSSRVKIETHSGNWLWTLLCRLESAISREFHEFKMWKTNSQPVFWVTLEICESYQSMTQASIFTLQIIAAPLKIFHVMKNKKKSNKKCQFWMADKRGRNEDKFRIWISCYNQVILCWINSSRWLIITT